MSHYLNFPHWIFFSSTIMLKNWNSNMRFTRGFSRFSSTLKAVQSQDHPSKHLPSMKKKVYIYIYIIFFKIFCLSLKKNCDHPKFFQTQQNLTLVPLAIYQALLKKMKMLNRQNSIHLIFLRQISRHMIVNFIIIFLINTTMTYFQSLKEIGDLVEKCCGDTEACYIFISLFACEVSIDSSYRNCNSIQKFSNNEIYKK